MKSLENLLTVSAKDLGLNLPPSAKKAILSYIDLLLKWNRAYNLIGTDDSEVILKEHIMDSLAIMPYIKGQRIIDVGTGAGFPGIPLALAFPEKQFVLLDSVGKKTRFLTQVVAELQLTNVTVAQERVEKYSPAQCFDHIVARAFGTIDDIIAKTRHLCCSTGSWLLMKGLYPAEELESLQAKVTSHKIQIPGLKKERHLICIENRHD